jgi:hypothetical protein
MMILSDPSNQKINGKIKNFGLKSNLFLQVKWTPAKYLMADW